MTFKSILVSGLLALTMAFAPLAGASDKNDTTDVKKEVEAAQQDQTAENAKRFLRKGHGVKS